MWIIVRAACWGARSSRRSRRRSGPPCAGRSRSSSAPPARRRPRTGSRSWTRGGRAGRGRRSGPARWRPPSSARFDTTISPVALSTQRNAGIPSVEPWRIPHWLTPVCEDHPVSHPTRRCDAGPQPAIDRRRVTGSQRPPQHGLGEAVDLDEHDTGHVRRRGDLGAASGGAGHAAVEPRVVVERQRRRYAGGDRRQADDDQRWAPRSRRGRRRAGGRAPAPPPARRSRWRPARASAPRSARRRTPAAATRRRSGGRPRRRRAGRPRGCRW